MTRQTYTCVQAANVLGLTERRVRQLVADGKLEGYRTVQGGIELPVAAVEAEATRRRERQSARRAEPAPADATTPASPHETSADGPVAALDVRDLATQVAAEVERNLRASWETQVQEILSSSVQEERARRYLAEERLTDLMSELLQVRRSAAEALAAPAPTAALPAPEAPGIAAAPPPLALDAPAVAQVPTSTARGRRRRRRGSGPLVAIGTLAVVLGTLAVAARSADAYEASATIRLPEGGLSADDLTAVGEVEPVVTRVADTLALEADEVTEGLDASSEGPEAVNFTFRDGDGDRAQTAASVAAETAVEVATERRTSAVEEELAVAKLAKAAAQAELDGFVSESGLLAPAVDLELATAELAELKLDREQAEDRGEDARVAALDGSIALRQQRVFDLRYKVDQFEDLQAANAEAEQQVADAEAQLFTLADQADAGGGRVELGDARAVRGVSPLVLVGGLAVAALVLLLTRRRPIRAYA